MRKTTSRYLTCICYSLFFVLALFVFLHLTFPVEVLRQRIIYEIEERTPFEADIQSVSVSPILRLDVYGINLLKAGKPFLDVDDLEVRSSLIHLLSDSPKIPFKANLLGGATEGNLTYDFKGKRITAAEARLNGINIEKVVPMISSDPAKQGPLIQGIVDGSFSVNLDSGGRGKFDFKITDLGVGNIKIKDFDVPALSSLTSTLAGSIEGGTTRVEKFQVEGADVHLELSGTMPLIWKIHHGGKIDFQFKLFSVGDKFGLLRAFLESRGSGTLGGKIVGTLTSPRVVLPERDRL